MSERKEQIEKVFGSFISTTEEAIEKMSSSFALCLSTLSDKQTLNKMLVSMTNYVDNAVRDGKLTYPVDIKTKEPIKDVSEYILFQMQSLVVVGGDTPLGVLFLDNVNKIYHVLTHLSSITNKQYSQLLSQYSNNGYKVVLHLLQSDKISYKHVSSDGAIE